MGASIALTPAQVVTADAPTEVTAWSDSSSTTSGLPIATRTVAEGVNDSAVFAYDNFAPSIGGGGASGTWEFTTVANAVGDPTVDYRWEGFHAFFQVTVGLQAVVIRGGTVVSSTSLVNDGPINCCSSPSAGFEYVGSHTFTGVQVGDVYGFRMAGSNGDSNSRLRGRLIVGAPGTVHADTVVLNGYDQPKTDGEWGLTEDFMVTTRGYLRNPANFGPSGLSPTEYIVADGVNVASAETLMGTDAFFTGWVVTTDYTAADRAALVDFVAGGGSLIATTDDTGHDVTDTFGLTLQDGTTNPSTFDDGNHPIANGPFGTQTTYNEYGSVGSFLNVGSNATVVARNAAGDPTLAEIAPGELGPGSGLSLFVSDVDFFTNWSTGSIDNEILIKNLFEYVAATRRPAPSEIGEAQLFQAVPAADPTVLEVAVAAQVTGPANSTQDLTLVTSSTCVDGVLGTATDLGSFSVAVGPTGETIFVDSVTVNAAPGPYAALRVGPAANGTTTACVVAGPANDSWIRALEIPLTVDTEAEVATGAATGFLDSLGNSRWFRFQIRPGTRVTVDLTSLPDDYDLALYTDIAQAFTSIDDVDDLNQLGAEFAPSVFSPSVFSPSVFSPSVFSPSVFSPSVFSPSVFSPSVFSPSVFSPDANAPSVFSPENFASAQTRSLIAVSAVPGTGDELVVADTWSNTGDFYVRVTGKNGEFDAEDSFALDVSVDGVDCAAVAPIPPSGGPAPSGPAGGGSYGTLILHDPARLAASYPNDAALAELETKLSAYAARSEVAGKIVDLGQYPHINALHDQADANTSCPYAENLLASAIKDIADGYRALNPNLEYITIVGSDAQVPFFRYPDQALLGPEQDYEPPVAELTQSQSALRRNYILGQDEYGASRVINLAAGRFPLPKLAVGRIVENASEMITMLDAYLATDGGVVPTPTSSLVTGYDFLTDNAEAVDVELVAGTNKVGVAADRNDTLITAADISPDDPRSWNADDLRAELFGDGEDLIFLAGHFSANSALAADYTTTVLATELAASDVDLTNSIVFSGGCHSGYNIVDGDAVPLLTEPLDWTQAFAQKGATLVAGTGYQYGDTDFIEYSERLYVLFARELRRGTGPVAVGDALARAKQEYLATTPEIRGLHRKSVIISTVFGLPNLKVDMPGERYVDPPGGSTVTPAGAPVGTPGGQLGLQIADLDLLFAGDLVPNSLELTNLEDPLSPITAHYLSGPNGVVVNPAEPVLPLVRTDVSVNGQSLRGVGFRGGAWSEDSVTPLTGAPTTELRGVHTPFVSTVNFPMRLATPNYFGALTETGGTGLSITPVQHRVAQIGDVEATRRVFSALDLRLFYSSNTTTYSGNTPALSAPPSFAGVKAVRDGDDVLVGARVVGDPAAGIQSVWVTYTDGSQSSGTWEPLDLVQDPDDSTQWTGRIVGGGLFGRLDFLVQAVNGVGLVTVDDNFGAYYSVVGTLGEAPVPPTPTTLTVSGPATAIYGETIQASATLLDDTNTPVAGKSVIFTLGGSGRAAVTDTNGVATAQLPVTATPGTYPLVASFAGASDLVASSARQPIDVSRAPTALQLVQVTPQLTPNGVEPGIGARLGSNGTPLLQRTVLFEVSSGGATVTVARITDNTGRARLGPIPVPVGTYDVTVRFPGDPIYQPTSVGGSFDVEVFEVPIDPVPITTPVEVTVSVSDTGPTDLVTTTIDWGDGGPVEEIVDGPTASHTYANAGVYELTMEVCHTDGRCSSVASDYIVVYDPTAGFVTGGGWIWSPQGAVQADPSIEGKASFGFVSKYQKGATVPTGNTNFQFKAADLHFESTAYEWLVVSGQRAQYRGSGTINGGGSYDFTLTGVEDPATFRLQIWSRDGGGLVYDNDLDENDAIEGTALSGGSIKIHTPKGKN